MKLFKVSTETEFNELVAELKKAGYVWATDFPNHEPTYKECKSFYHGNSKLLIHAFFNSITSKREFQVTTLSVLKTYPQYKGFNIRKGIVTCEDLQRYVLTM